VFSAGAAGTEMLSASVVQSLSRAKVIVDVNAVPPLGVGGIKVDDQGASRGGKVFFGAIGVGGLKMKIHRRAIQSLFETNQAVLDAVSIFELGQAMTQIETAR
jgi:hypothetical protein